MKCLSCHQNGKHFLRKICPNCKAKGISRDDIHADHMVEYFQSYPEDEDAGIQAGKFVTKLKKERHISHLKFKYSVEDEFRTEEIETKVKGKKKPVKTKVRVQVELKEMEVRWIQYEHKDKNIGGTHGSKEVSKS